MAGDGLPGRGGGCSFALNQFLNAMKKTRKTGNCPRSRTLQLVCATVLMAMGMALLAAGFITPPTGEIAPSVLVAFGEILTFAGAIFGIDYHYRA